MNLPTKAISRIFRVTVATAMTCVVLATVAGCPLVGGGGGGADECQTNADCDDGLFCNGEELCTAGACASPAGTPCDETQECDEAADACSALPQEFLDASATRGGGLYDKWWVVSGAEEPTDNHPLYPAEGQKSGSTTWRCKECHGWDYKGNAGAYGSQENSHYTGIAGIFGTTMLAQDVFDLIETDHGYGAAGLSSDDIWDLTRFVREEAQLDTDDLIDANGAFVGTAENGRATYESTCMGCHGEDGLDVPPGADDDRDEWVGKIANDNPWEFQHKVRFGQPTAQGMPPQAGVLTTAEIADLGAHAQTLPTDVGQTTALSYVGTDRCLTCHGAGSSVGDMSAFPNSGHPFKLNKVENDQVPTYPSFTPGIDGALEMMADDDQASDDGATPDPNVGGTDNTLGTPQSYADISYVIGGYGWKARWIDADGYIVTGSSVQYNLEDQSWSSYHNNETDKPYNCGNCHTTGWRAYTSADGDDRNLNRQDDLPGMAGTFAAPGVHCEACHGAGSAHVENPSEDNITKVASPRTTEDFLAEDMAYGKPVACSECHTRQGEMDYPDYTPKSAKIEAKGGLIRHHEQWDEMMGVNPDDEAGGPTGPHSSLACTACHDPHRSTIYQDVSGDGPGMTKPDCTGCHHTQTIAESSGMADLNCVDCHMPRLAKSAIGHAAVGTGPATGDIRSHIFRIDLEKENQFTAEGDFAYPWITVEFACKTCHNGVDAFDATVEFLSTVSVHGDE